MVRVRYLDGSGADVETTLDRVVVDEVVCGLPVREFRSYKGRRHYSGWYWCATMDRLVVYESRLELARLMLADFDPGVTGIAAQPFQLVGADGPRIRRHVPDFLVVDAAGGVTVVDVKAASRRDDVEVRALMDWTRRTAALRGWGFEEWYGAPRTLLANVSFLAGYRRGRVVDGSLIPSVLAAASAGASIGDIERILRPLDALLVRPVVLHLLWRGLLHTDLTRSIDPTSVVSVRLAAVGSA